MSFDADVLIIGAGPSGAMAAAHLRRLGRSVLILEREQFPRFSIGESLLPQSMELLEEAGLLRPVVEAGFQYKNGATFVRGERFTSFDFRDKFGEGWGTTYQVDRATFDHVLAKAAERMGAEVRYRHEILDVDVSGPGASLKVKAPDGSSYQVSGRFLLDASGFGRVLPRLLKLERPSAFPARRAIFSHVEDRISPSSGFDRNKIRVGVHPEHVDIWYWLIPFSNGRASVGVVGAQEQLGPYTNNLNDGLKALHFEDPGLKELLGQAVWDTPARQIMGYAADVASLTGPHFALLGNAGEFLDPVFSSGVTIAFKSASLATPLIERELKGEPVDWDREYSQPLRRGVDTFRSFVEAWYRGSFQDIIFYEHPDPSNPSDDLFDLGWVRLGSGEPIRGRAAQAPQPGGDLRVALTSLLGLLAGCAVFASRPADPGLALLPPSAAGRQVSLSQSVRMTSDKGASFEALTAVEIDPRWLRVAAVGPMGNRIMLLEWDGRSYQEERDPHVPAEFPLKVVLRDLELALFPAAAVRGGLPSSDWTLLERPRGRELLLDGTPVIRIEYSTDDPYTSTIHFKHLTLGYQLEIRPADTD